MSWICHSTVERRVGFCNWRCSSSNWERSCWLSCSRMLPWNITEGASCSRSWPETKHSPNHSHDVYIWRICSSRSVFSSLNMLSSVFIFELPTPLLVSSFPRFDPHVHLELRSLLFSTTDVPFQLFDLDVSVSCEFLFIVLLLPLDSCVEIIQCFQILIDPLLLLFELLYFSPVFLHLRAFQFDPLFLELVEIRLQIVFVRCSKEDKRMFNQSFLSSSFNCLSRWSSRTCRSIASGQCSIDELVRNG